MWWIKKFRRRKMQSALIFLVIAMCSTLISGSLVILTSLNSVYENLADETGAPDIKVYGQEGYYKDYNKALSNCEQVDRVTGIDTYSVSTIKKGQKEEDVFLDICVYEEEVYKDVRIIEGSNDKPEEGECFLPKVIADCVDAKTGDTIIVRIDGKDYEYRIAAIYAELFSIGSQFTCDMLVPSLPEGTKTKGVYAVWLKVGYEVNDLISDYTKENDGIIDAYFRSRGDAIANAKMTEMILGGILLGISAVVFLAILLILDYIIKNSLRQEKNTIAIYKTMGYSNNRIRNIYIMFYISVIASGAVVGGMASPVLYNSFIKSVYKNTGYSGVTNGVSQIIGCIVVIIIFALLLIVKETGRINGFRPVEIFTLADKKDMKKKRKRSGSVVSFSPLSMALRMMRRDKKNTILLVITCIVSLYIVNISVVSLENVKMVRGESNYYWLGIDKHDITIENKGDKDKFYEICEQIKRDDKVKNVVRRNYNIGLTIPYKESVTAMLYESFDDMECGVVDGRNPKYDNEICLSNKLLKDYGLNLGDYITVQLDENVRTDMLIVGSFQGFFNMGQSARMIAGTYDKFDINWYEYTEASVILESPDEVDSYIKELKKLYGSDIKVINRMNLMEQIMNTICDPQEAALLPFVIITVIIGALNVFYIIYASNAEKRKKYTIYKSIGYTSGHLLKMNCIYVGIIAIISIAVAVPLLIFVFPKIMLLAMSSFGFAEYKLVIKAPQLIITNVIMLLIFVASAMAAARDIFRNYIAAIMNE